MMTLLILPRQVLRHLRENPLRRDEVRQRNSSRPSWTILSLGPGAARSSSRSGVPALHWDEAVVRLQGEVGREQRAALDQIRCARSVGALALLVPRLPAAKAKPQVASQLGRLAFEAAMPHLQAVGGI